MFERIKYPFFVFVSSVVVLIFFLFSTSPVEGGPFVIIIFLSLVFFVIYSLILLCLNVLPEVQRQGIVITKQAKRYAGLAIASGVVYLLGLATVGQLQVVDAILVFLFELMIVFYILRRL